MASNNTYGHIDEYQPELESFRAYSERIQLFFLANKIPESRRVAVLLSIMGTKNFSLLRDLIAPEKPSDKTVIEILSVLTA